MSLQEFTDYLASCGEDINTLTKEEKRAWRETFDKSRQASGTAGGSREAKICTVKCCFREILTIQATFKAASDILETARNGITIAKPNIPRGVNLTTYRLYDLSGRIIIDYDALVHDATYYFAIPNVLDAVSANYWTQKHMADLGIKIKLNSKDEFMDLLMKGRTDFDFQRANVLIESLKLVSPEYVQKLESKNQPEEELRKLRNDSFIQHPIIKALFLIRKYSNLESSADAFVQLLLFYLGYFEDMLFAFPRLKLPLIFGDDEKDAIADFVILDILSYFRMAVLEDKSSDRDFVDSEAQMIGEAIASCQQNMSILGPGNKRQRTDTATTINEEIFGVRVNGTYFHFYLIPITNSILNAMESKTSTNIPTDVNKYELTLNFLVANDRETIILFLSVMRNSIVIKEHQENVFRPNEFTEKSDLVII